ncbi:MAG: glycosyltransferase family 2 protein [Candidatus Scalindua sp.]
MELEISIVVPIFNEEENISMLSSAIQSAMVDVVEPYECIFVDDGSTDCSNKEMRKVCKEYNNFRIVRLRENCGQTAALDAGFKASRGEYIVMMDADLQNDPFDIPLLIANVKGYDMVYGWRFKRQDSFVKKVSSKVANFVRNKLTDENIKDIGCSLKIFRRDCLRKIKLYNGMHRFLPTLFKMEGFSVKEVKVKHNPRIYGKSKYNIRNRIFKSFLDLLAVRWMKKRNLYYEEKDE